MNLFLSVFPWLLGSLLQFHYRTFASSLFPPSWSFPSLGFESQLYLSHHQLSPIFASCVLFWLVEQRWLNPPHSSNTASSSPTLRYQIMHKWNRTYILVISPSSSPLGHVVRSNNISWIGWSFSIWPWPPFLALRLNKLNLWYQN